LTFQPTWATWYQRRHRKVLFAGVTGMACMRSEIVRRDRLLLGFGLVVWLARGGERVAALRTLGCHGVGNTDLRALGRSRLALARVRALVIFIWLPLGRVSFRALTGGELGLPDRVVDRRTDRCERIALLMIGP
jgi:hypothetical protein